VIVGEISRVQYTTTIHVLNSAIIKLARQQKICRVYRGISGGVLPREFWYKVSGL
jgi:hypothetical protein